MFALVTRPFVVFNDHPRCCHCSGTSHCDWAHRCVTAESTYALQDPSAYPSYDALVEPALPTRETTRHATGSWAPVQIESASGRSFGRPAFYLT
jgi:hypothetical protein